MLIRAAFLLALLPSLAMGHSLEPGRVSAYAINGVTQFRITAVNRFSENTRFVFEAYTDDTLTNPVDFNLTDFKFTLQPNQKRSFRVLLRYSGEQIYICTRTVDEAREGAGFSTRVCSKAKLKQVIR